MHTNPKKQRMSGAGIMLVMLFPMLSGGCARLYHMMHYNTMASVWNEHRMPYYHSPATGRILPNEHHRVCPIEFPCYGYQPTCWHRWPKECVACPVQGDEGCLNGVPMQAEEIISDSVYQPTPAGQQPAADESNDSGDLEKPSGDATSTPDAPADLPADVTPPAEDTLGPKDGGSATVPPINVDAIPFARQMAEPTPPAMASIEIVQTPNEAVVSESSPVVMPTREATVTEESNKEIATPTISDRQSVETRLPKQSLDVAHTVPATDMQAHLAIVPTADAPQAVTATQPAVTPTVAPQRHVIAKELGNRATQMRPATPSAFVPVRTVSAPPVVKKPAAKPATPATTMSKVDAIRLQVDSPPTLRFLAERAEEESAAVESTSANESTLRIR